MDEGAFLEETLAFLASIGLRANGKKFELNVFFDASGAVTDAYGQTATVIRLYITHERWSVIAQTPNKMTTIVARADGVKIMEDELGIAKQVKKLADVGARFREIERALGVEMPRVAFVRNTNIKGAKKAVDAWVATL